MNARETWIKANRQLVAKALGELTYEQVLKPVKMHEGEKGTYPARDVYTLPLESGIVYRFRAWVGVWDHPRVDPDSIERYLAPIAPEIEVSAAQFFVDAQKELGMDDTVLGNFLEELHSTLHADQRLLQRNAGLSATDMAEWDGNRVQAFFNGHPKILLNKGRMGWGAQAARDFAPENEPEFRLRWIAVDRALATIGALDADAHEQACLECLGTEALSAFRTILAERGKRWEEVVLVPVHPWQWDRVIELQFARELAVGEMVDLGTAGDRFRPQISIRTLSNADRPKSPDVKLPLTILNTSAVRGIPARYIEGGPAVAKALSAICDEDQFLNTSGTAVLREKAGVSVVHREFAQLKNAPYRYHETLGSIWRESVDSKLRDGETAVLTAALFHQDEKGQSLIGAYVRKSGLPIGEWLERYFESVVLPLYHLQVTHGIGLVAHGQNTVLRLKNFVPTGLFLKDFQGDLRLAKGGRAESEPSFRHLDRLPPEHLIHDLVTGHFVTVLRFVSETLAESDAFPESEFYRILSQKVRAYITSRPSGVITAANDLLSGRVARVLLNPVRFKIGYSDRAERPLPMLGRDLVNPLQAFASSGVIHG